VESIRAILAAHPSGISRAGILAWAKLRIDPDFDEVRLDAELAELEPEIVERDGFLWLASSAGAPVSTQPASSPAPSIEPVTGAIRQGSGRLEEPPAEGGIEGWTAPAGRPSGWSDGRPTAGPGDGASTEAGTGPIAGWTGSRPRMPPAVLVLLAVIAIAIVVTNLLGGSLADEGTAPSAVQGSLGPVEDLSVGDCIAIPGEAEFSEVRFVACDAPHDAEVFFMGDHEGDGGFPDDTAFEAFVDERCLPAFETYTGSPFDGQSLLDLGWFTPTAESWTFGDRTIHCYLTPLDGSMTSMSYQGAKP